MSDFLFRCFQYLLHKKTVFKSSSPSIWTELVIYINKFASADIEFHSFSCTIADFVPLYTH